MHRGNRASSSRLVAGGLVVALIATTAGAMGGRGAADAATAPSPPARTEWFTPVVPARLLDTRPGSTTIDGAGRPGRPVGAGGTLDLVVVGRGGVPATGVAAVVLNVTATGPTASSFLTVWPAGAKRPDASNLNVVPAQTVPNLVVAKVGVGGKVSIFNRAGSVDVIADVSGYFPTTDGFEPLVPARLLDTRPGASTIDGGGRPGRPIGEGSSIDLVVTGRGGVPKSGVGAVVLNVTATNASAASFVTVWPTGTSRPVASNLNTVLGLTVPNLVVAKVGVGGKVSIFNRAGSVDVIADVAGWFPTGGTFVPMRPARVLETRPGQPVAPGGTITGVPMGADAAFEFPVLGVGGVPSAGVSAVVLNVTAIQAATPSFLTAWPYGAPRPTASNVNMRGGNQTIANLVVAKIGAGGKVAIYNRAGNVDVAVDVAGYFQVEPADARSVDADAGATCEVDVHGSLACWGNLPQDDLAFASLAAPPSRTEPYPLGMFGDAVDVATGWTHTCALRAAGTVWCWGGGGVDPVIGDGTTLPRWPMVQVPGLTDVVDIDAGYLNTCALRGDGTVWCWGAGFGGGARSLPTKVAGLANITSIALDTNPAACALRADHRVLCWGQLGSTGVLGDGSGTDSTTPRLVAGLTDAVSIHLQSLRGCAVRATGAAVCWGNSMLGDGGAGGRSLTPLPVIESLTGDPATDIEQVVGGDDWACALRSDAAVYCWGTRQNGAVGLTPSETNTTNSITSAVGGLPPIARLSAGRFHVCATTTGGAVYCWGRNADGQVGDGTTDDQPTPTLVLVGG